MNLGAGEARGQPPHVTGKNFLKRFGISEKSASAYALTDQGFEELAKSYGRIGGLDRLSAVVKRVRAERGDDKVLFLDGGDTWQGSLGANRSKGQDMVDCMALLKPDAMTGHWEFTYGEARVKELIDRLGFPFLALNIRDTEGNLTGAYLPKGTPSKPGQVIPAQKPCGGAIHRARLKSDSSYTRDDWEVYAMGLRNSSGVAFGPKGSRFEKALVVSDNGQNDKGNRRVSNGAEKLFVFTEKGQDAGFPEAKEGQLSDRMVDALVIHGTAAQVKARLREVPSFGAAELLAMPILASGDAAGLTRTLEVLGELAAE